MLHIAQHKRQKNKLVQGIGLNDADYPVRTKVCGKRTMCPFYARWSDMLKRCYCLKFQASRPTYLGCYVSDEWLTFSNFKTWMVTQDWKGKHLDKDLKLEGNKLYSAETCIFVPPEVNSVFTKLKTNGIYFDVSLNKYRTSCLNVHIGRFDSYESARFAYGEARNKYILKLADNYSGELSELIRKQVRNYA